jgi:hypothetical protein
VETVSQIFYTPFEKIFGWFKLIMRPINKISIKYHNYEYVTVKFNLMLLDDSKRKKQFSYVGTGYGYTIKNFHI